MMLLSVVLTMFLIVKNLVCPFLLYRVTLNTAEKSLAYMSNNSYQQKQNRFLNLFN